MTIWSGESRMSSTLRSGELRHSCSVLIVVYVISRALPSRVEVIDPMKNFALGLFVQLKMPH